MLSYQAAKQDPLTVLHSDGHLCIMEVMCSTTHKPDDDENDSYPILLLCLDFLTYICKSSRQGRLSVATSQFAVKCVDVACDLILKATECIKNDVATACAEAELKLLALSFSFLAELAHVNPYRKDIAQKATLLEACSEIAKNCTDVNTTYEVVHFLTTLAPTIADDCVAEFPPDNLAETFCLVFKSTRLLMRDDGETDKATVFSVAEYYELLATAVSGLECVFGRITSNESLIDDLSYYFEKLVMDLIDGKEITSNAGILACSLTSLFLAMIGEESRRIFLIKSSIIRNMCRLIIAHLKGSNQRPVRDTIHWRATRAHCLQCVASLLCKDSFRNVFIAGFEDVALSSDFDDNELRSDNMNSNSISFRQFLCAVDQISQDSSDAIATIAAQTIYSKLK